MIGYLFRRLRMLLFSVFITCSADAAILADTAATAVGKHGRLRVQGATLLDQHGKPAVLRGVSLGWHNWWPRFYNSETIKWLAADWKATVVRAAIGVGPQGSYLDNPDFALECLYQVVDAALAEGVYVIIDWHSHEIHTPQAKDFFGKVATKYKGYPNVIYEIYNEPVDDSWAEVKAYAAEVISVIRSIDEQAVILVGCPHWDQDIHLVADDPIEGYDNIMYTVHFYAATHKQALRDRADYAIAKGIPVFISECAGMEATGNGPIDHEEWQRWVKWMQKNSLSWVAWSIADKDETCSMIKDTDAPVASWKKEHLKDWGQIIRAELRDELIRTTL